MNGVGKMKDNKDNSNKDNNNKINKAFKKKPNVYCIILIIVLILEVFVFNYRFWYYLGNEPVELRNFTVGSGIEYIDDKKIKVNKSGDKEIEFTGLDVEANNIYLDVYNERSKMKKEEKDGIGWDFNKMAIVVYATDDGNSKYFEIPQRFVVEEVERTKYIPIESSGKTDKIKLKFNDCDGQTIILNSIQINKEMPFSFNIIRIAFIYIIFFVLYLLRRSSKIYDIIFKWNENQRLAVIIAIVINISISAMICFTNPRFIGIHIQYHDLAESFLNGEVSLKFEPPQSLIDMENPYDKNARDEVMANAGTTYKWDHAYYNGKYYVYFGALPVLTYYLPYLAKTGEEFPVHVGVFINIIVFIIFSYLLIKAIVDRWFKNIPFVTYLLLCQVYVFSSGMIFGLRKADLYATPITMGLALATAGLYFWFSTLNSKKDISRLVRLCLGSLCISLLAACRPQFLIAAFLCIPLFGAEIIRDKKNNLFSAKPAAYIIAFAAPVIIVATAVMMYNYARFSSPFDFGANYNLTTNDMTHRGMRLDRVGLSLFANFIQLPATTVRFPFIKSTDLSNYYGGVTIMETMFGGIFATQPLLWFCFILKNVYEKLKEKNVFALVVTFIVFSLIVGVVDAEMAGILCRYYMDFSYLSIIAAIFIALSSYEKYNGRAAYVISVLACLSLCYDFAAMFVLGDYGHEWANPNFYYGITSALTFWM